MSRTDTQQHRLPLRSVQLARRCLRICGYQDDLVEERYELANGKTVPLVSFAHRPKDARSCCLAFLAHSDSPESELTAIRELGAPLAIFAEKDSWKVWSLRTDGPRLDRSVRVADAPKFFEEHQADFAPGTVFRAKTWALAEGGRQLDFVDAGWLPLIEAEAGARLRQLFEEMVAHAMDALDLRPETLSDADAHWLTKANFWLLAGKLLRDKQVPRFVRLNLNDVDDVFERVAEHYGAERIRVNGRLRALRGAAAVAANFASLRCISTETLGALYEEALLSERTRKLLSVHRTPTYLVDYMIAKLSRWIGDEIGIENCQVFEPACGHSPFLVGAVRLLSDLLPNKFAENREARRTFLRKHMGGCDRDTFALEIARLSLTLADIPNPNGWQLDSVADMFAGDYLERNIAASSVILANPPFESVPIDPAERSAGDLRFHRNGQAAELLRRIIRFAHPGTAFGIVVPQTILEGNWFTALRRELLSQCEIKEITIFPDKVFQFADVETGIILARKRAEEAVASPSYLFRRIREPQMSEFIESYRARHEVRVSVKECLGTRDANLLAPGLASLWKLSPGGSRLTDMAMVAHGLYFLPSTHPDFPKGQKTVADIGQPGFVAGFVTAKGKWETHLGAPMTGMNLDSRVIEWPMEGTALKPQVLMNSSRIGRGAWRLKAFIDEMGRPFTSRFIVLRAKAICSMELLWALCNSPFANAYSYTGSGKRHIDATVLREMPVPDLKQKDLKAVNAAVRNYLVAARKFSREQPPGSNESKRKQKAGGVKKVRNENQLELGVEANAAIEPSVTDRLRALHWRVDAEVLKLYSLPGTLERELLDSFDGMVRLGVPFDQKEYIPLSFKEVQRLDEFLMITDEWEKTDGRRCELIERRIQHGRRTEAEEEEFKQLQRLFDLRRSYLRWQASGDAHPPLFDESKLKELQALEM